MNTLDSSKSTAKTRELHSRRIDPTRFRQLWHSVSSYCELCSQGLACSTSENVTSSASPLGLSRHPSCVVASKKPTLGHGSVVGAPGSSGRASRSLNVPSQLRTKSGIEKIDAAEMKVPGIVPLSHHRSPEGYKFSLPSAPLSTEAGCYSSPHGKVLEISYGKSIRVDQFNCVSLLFRSRLLLRLGCKG